MTAIISFGFVQRFQQRKVSCLNPSQLTLRCCCSVRRGKLGCSPDSLDLPIIHHCSRCILNPLEYSTQPMRPSIHFETHCSTHRSQPTFQNYSLDLCAMFFWRTVKNPCFHIAIFWGRLSSYGVPRVSSVPGPVCRWELPTDDQNYEKGRAERMKGALLVCFFCFFFGMP